MGRVMVSWRKALLPALVVGGLTAGFGTGMALSGPAAPARPAGPPVMGIVGPLFAPVWTHGTVGSFVAAEVQVTLAPGHRLSEQAPLLEDRMLAELVRVGAEGGLEPGRVQADALSARLLAVAREGGAPVTAASVVKLVRQENRRP